MSYENKGSFGPTVTVSREPDRSGNFVCDGVADDVQIQAALDYVNVLGGGTVYIKQGTYTLQDGGFLLMYSDTRLTGDGTNTLIRSPTNIANFRGMLENANRRVAGPVIDENIEIDHIQFDGRQGEQANTAAGIIYMENVLRVHIHHCFFRDATGYMVLFQGLAGSTAPCDQIYAYWNYTENSQFNFWGTSSSDGTNNITNVIVAFNYVTDTDTAISFLGNVLGVICHGNMCVSNKNVDQFLNGGGIAIESDGVQFAPEAVIVSNNYVTDGRAGIGTVNANGTHRGIVIIGNILYDNYSTTAEGYGTNFGVGIHLAANSVDCIISGNVTFTPGEAAANGTIIRGARHTIIGNMNYGSIAAGGFGVQLIGDYFVYSGNFHYDVAPTGLHVDTSSRMVISSNYFYGGSGFARGLDFNTGDECFVTNNVFFDLDAAIDLDATSDNNLFQQNRFINCAFPLVSDAGTGNIYDSQFKQFQDGTTFISATGSAKGWEIDANAEYAIALLQLPPELQQIVRIDIWAVALATEADAMRLEINMNSGADNEAYTAEAVAIVNNPSATTNFAANDVIHWSVTSSDDADIGHMRGGESLEVQVLHEAAGGEDAETDAVFRVVEIQYV